MIYSISIYFSFRKLQSNIEDKKSCFIGMLCTWMVPALQVTPHDTIHQRYNTIQIYNTIQYNTIQYRAVMPLCEGKSVRLWTGTDPKNPLRPSPYPPNTAACQSGQRWSLRVSFQQTGQSDIWKLRLLGHVSDLLQISAGTSCGQLHRITEHQTLRWSNDPCFLFRSEWAVFFRTLTIGINCWTVKQSSWN